MRKKQLSRAVENLGGRLGDCELRVEHLQNAIRRFLAADSAGEMTEFQKAVEHLKNLMGES